MAKKYSLILLFLGALFIVGCTTIENPHLALLQRCMDRLVSPCADGESQLLNDGETTEFTDNISATLTEIAGEDRSLLAVAYQTAAPRSLKFAVREASPDWGEFTFETLNDAGEEPTLITSTDGVHRIFFRASFLNFALTMATKLDDFSGNCPGNASWRCETVETNNNIGEYRNLSAAYQEIGAFQNRTRLHVVFQRGDSNLVFHAVKDIDSTTGDDATDWTVRPIIIDFDPDPIQLEAQSYELVVDKTEAIIDGGGTDGLFLRFSAAKQVRAF